MSAVSVAVHAASARRRLEPGPSASGGDRARRSGSARSSSARGAGVKPPWSERSRTRPRSRPGRTCRRPSAIDALVEAARIVMNPTRATPIISADAVAAVRLGLRRGVLPGERPSCRTCAATGAADAPGRPGERSPGRARTRRRSPATRTETEQLQALVAVAGDAGGERAPRRRPVTHQADDARGAPTRPVRSTATSRSAAMGRTRLARTAGTTAETTRDARRRPRTTVTIVPVDDDRRTGGDLEADGAEQPLAARTPCRPRRPGRRPTAITPMAIGLEQRSTAAPAGGRHRSPAASPSPSSAGRRGSRRCCR